MIGCRSGGMIAPATTRTRSVAAATAANVATELGHGVAGSWLPIAAYMRGLSISPLHAASPPSIVCSLTITASNPVSSATCARRTNPRMSRSGSIVWFSVRIINSRGGTMAISLARGRRAATGQPVSDARWSTISRQMPGSSPTESVCCDGFMQNVVYPAAS